MVKRYSHTAIITVEPRLIVDGERVKGEKSEIVVKGQYFPSNSGQQVKRNSNGNEFTVRGEFSTKTRPVKDAVHIQIDSIGLDASIMDWEPFQTHSVIYV